MPDADTSDLAEIFDSIESSLLRFSPPLTVRRMDTSGKRNVHLWSEKEVVLDGRKRQELYFAGAIVHKGYVGFYFQPVYVDPVRADALVAPQLRALRTGKSCFRVTRLDDALLARVEDTLARGLGFYRERGWVD